MSSILILFVKFVSPLVMTNRQVRSCMEIDALSPRAFFLFYEIDYIIYFTANPQLTRQKYMRLFMNRLHLMYEKANQLIGAESSTKLRRNLRILKLAYFFLVRMKLLSRNKCQKCKLTFSNYKKIISGYLLIMITFHKL